MSVLVMLLKGVLTGIIVIGILILTYLMLLSAIYIIGSIIIVVFRIEKAVVLKSFVKNQLLRFRKFI
jgi:hypothetical protein